MIYYNGFWIERRQSEVIVVTNGYDMWERICLAQRHQTNSVTLYCFCLIFILPCGKGQIITICDMDKICNWNWAKGQILDGNSWNIQRVFRNVLLVKFIKGPFLISCLTDPPTLFLQYRKKFLLTLFLLPPTEC